MSGRMIASAIFYLVLGVIMLVRSAILLVEPGFQIDSTLLVMAGCSWFLWGIHLMIKEITR